MRENIRVTENKREEVIDKVRKCLALTRSPNEAEAKAALLMAQRILAKYHIDLREIDAVAAKEADEHCVKEWCTVKCMRPWVRELARVVARNFRCEVGFSSKGAHQPCFVGWPLDVQVAIQTFEVAVKVADLLGERLSQKISDSGECSVGVKATFCDAFVRGLDAAYLEQIKTDSLGLMVVAPKEAQAWKASLGKACGGFEEIHLANSAITRQGFQAGYEFANRDGLPASKKQLQ